MYYGYIRVSTETQAEKGYGLEAQEKSIKDYAAREGIKLETIFRDAGISGNLKDTDDDDAINKRVGLMDLLSVVEENDTIIVLNTSRLWRSDMTKALVRRELLKKNCNVYSIEQPTYDLKKCSSSPSDYLVNAIMEALDVYDRMSISLKLARGRTSKANKGDKPAGTCPYGYRYTTDKKHIEPDPAEAQTLRKIFTEAQRGTSLDKIAKILNDQGSRTRRGNAWQKGSLHVILKNNFYTGVVTHQGKEIPGNHEPLISKIQFGKVQANLRRNHR
jgi:DNA invertase Pin-like site-specific DNA recombinase